MTEIKKITDLSGTQVFPLTHTRAVIDDNGNTTESRLTSIEGQIAQKQATLVAGVNIKNINGHSMLGTGNIETTIPNNAAFTIKTKVGDADAVSVSNFTADQSVDEDVTFIQGDNVTLTSDAANKTITISSSVGTNLTDNTILLGNSGTGIKSSSKTIDSSSLDGTSDEKIPTSKAVATYVNSALTQVLKYKGTIGTTGATVTALPASHKIGDVYVVATAGTYAGKSVEIGDYIICNTDGTTANDSHWDVISGENQVVNSNANLSWGSSTKIATIDGTDINVGLPALSSATNNNSTTTAASSAAVKEVYDLANSKTNNIGTITQVGDTTTGTVTVTSANDLADYGETITVGSIGGVDLQFTMPNTPDLEIVGLYQRVVAISGSITNVTCPVDIQNGQQCHVLYTNASTSNDYTIAISTQYSTPNGEALELTAPAGGYAEVNYMKINGTIYARGL